MEYTQENDVVAVNAIADGTAYVLVKKGSGSVLGLELLHVNFAKETYQKKEMNTAAAWTANGVHAMFVGQTSDFYVSGIIT